MGIKTKSNPYKVSSNYLPEPTTSLYTNTDYGISEENYIQEIIEEVEGIQENISGDIDPSYVGFKIKHNKLSFVPSGCWLWKVRTYKSYKKTHKTFKQWCEDVCHITYSTALRMIKAATVWIDLATMGFEVLPTSISQCLVLYEVPQDELYHAWSTVIETLPPHHITASSMNIILNGEPKKISTNINLPVDLFLTLQYLAHKAATTVSNVVAWMYHELFIRTTKVANVEPSKIQMWEEDLQDLVRNYEG